MTNLDPRRRRGDAAALLPAVDQPGSSNQRRPASLRLNLQRGVAGVRRRSLSLTVLSLTLANDYSGRPIYVCRPLSQAYGRPRRLEKLLWCVSRGSTGVVVLVTVLQRRATMQLSHLHPPTCCDVIKPRLTFLSYALDDVSNNKIRIPGCQPVCYPHQFAHPQKHYHLPHYAHGCL